MECEARSEIINRYEDSRREADQAAHDQDLPATARRAMLDREAQAQSQPAPADLSKAKPAPHWLRR